MTNTVYTKIYNEPPYDVKEILRYAGAKEPLPELWTLAWECIEEAQGKLVYKVCSREYRIRRADGVLDLGFAVTDSEDLRRNLQGCDRIVLFAATVGIGIDRLIRKYSDNAPSKALLFQAIGAERIESLCGLFNAEIKMQAEREGRHTAARFSPGYGDLPLLLQRDIFRVLDCPRKIGLTLNESLLMSPSKSVTAVIGVGERADSEGQSGCAGCEKTDCAYGRTV